MSVKEWLDSLSLPQYYTLFVTKGYDSLDRCTALTSADLKVIGITLPGHQKRILSNLVKVPNDAPNPSGRPVTPEASEVFPTCSVGTPPNLPAIPVNKDQCIARLEVDLIIIVFLRFVLDKILEYQLNKLAEPLDCYD